MVVGADPEGSVLSGDTARPYLTEGVGEDFFPGTYDPTVVDRWVRVCDRDAFAMARRITREEGILAGESCGTALVAALDGRPRADRRPDGGHDAVIVVLLPDGGRNYLSKLYNDEWMRVNGLLATTGAIARVATLLARPATTTTDRPAVVVARTTERVGDAIEHAPALRHQPDAGVRGRRRRRDRGHRRVDQREGPARPRVPRPDRSSSGPSAR